MSVMWLPSLKTRWLRTIFFICFMKKYSPKNNFNKFKKNLSVEMFPITSPTSCNIKVFCMKCR